MRRLCSFLVLALTLATSSWGQKAAEPALRQLLAQQAADGRRWNLLAPIPK